MDVASDDLAVEDIQDRQHLIFRILRIGHTVGVHRDLHAAIAAEIEALTFLQVVVFLEYGGEGAWNDDGSAALCRRLDLPAVGCEVGNAGLFIPNPGGLCDLRRPGALRRYAPVMGADQQDDSDQHQRRHDNAEYRLSKNGLR